MLLLLKSTNEVEEIDLVSCRRCDENKGRRRKTREKGRKRKHDKF